MKKKAHWTHKKYGKRKYYGYYRYVDNEREFLLVHGDTQHIITFESHEAAKALGWKICNPK